MDSEVLVTSEAESLIDLAFLRDLLTTLTDYKVKAFSVGNMAIAFHESEVQPPYAGRSADLVKVDEERSTSSKQVRGFTDAPEPGIWHHPALWAGQGGKTLQFDGRLNK